MNKKAAIFTSIASFTLLLCGWLLAVPHRAAALSGSEFNNARIIDDDIFFDRNTMNTGDIQNFFNAKMPSCDPNGTEPSGRSGYATRADWGRANGAPPPYTCLKNYSQSFNSVGADAYCGGISGGTKSAADIVFNVAQACGINPKVLIVLLQKEQSLLTDEWPWPVQYRSATGYGCPDTAACDSQYYGFFNQVYNAGRQFKRYVQQPHLFNYAVGRTSYVAYQANAPSCGGTNIGMQTQATAALYNYTPYQPNAAALANLYGTGDGCSAYGNRNFWRMFRDWFGPVHGDGYTLAVNSSDSTQWVIYRNIRQYVPSAEIKRAWNLPDAAVSMTADYLATIPQGPELGRLFHRIGDPALYFADNGKKYYVPSSQMKDAWGFTGQTEAFVSSGLWSTTSDGGWLTYSVKSDDSSALYMVDGQNDSGQTVLRQYNSTDVFQAWEGDSAGYVTLSDDYFGTIDNAVGTALTKYTAKASGDSTQYHVVAGQKLYLSGAMAAVYNQTYETVNADTIARLVTSAPVTNFIRLPGNGVTIYMVDNGVKYPVSSINTLLAWSPGGVPPTVNILNQGFLNLLTSGASLNTYQADVSGQLYVMDGQKIPVPAGLDTGYRTANVFAATSALMSLFNTASNATNFIKGSGPSIYLMDDATIKHIGSIQSWQLWNGTRNESVTTVREFVLSMFTHGGIIGHYVTSGGTNYVMDNGTYRSVSGAVATDWNLSSPTSIDADTLGRFTSGTALSQKAKVGSTYYRVKYGQSNATTDASLATLWGVDSSPVEVGSVLVQTVTAGPGLSIFARSTDSSDHRIFLADTGGSYYHIESIPQFQNYGYSGGPIVPVSPSDLGTPGTAKNVLKTSTANSERVIDNGAKRNFIDSTARGRWVTGSNTLTVSSTLWNYISSGSDVGSNLKASAPNVYNIDSGEKRWITSQSAYQTYVSDYGSVYTISDYLANTLPTGSNIP